MKNFIHLSMIIVFLQLFTGCPQTYFPSEEGDNPGIELPDTPLPDYLNSTQVIAENSADSVSDNGGFSPIDPSNNNPDDGATVQEITEDCFLLEDGAITFSFGETSEHYTDVLQNYSDTGLTLFTQTGTENLNFAHNNVTIINTAINTKINRHGLIFARDGFFNEGTGNTEFLWILLEYTGTGKGKVYFGSRTFDGNFSYLPLDNSTLDHWNTSGNILSVSRSDSSHFSLNINGQIFPLTTDREFTGDGFGFIVELSSLEISLIDEGYDLQLIFSDSDRSMGQSSSVIRESSIWSGSLSGDIKKGFSHEE